MNASRFLSGFYILNVVSLLLYILPRTWYLSEPAAFHSSFTNPSAFLSRERQAFGLLALSLAFKVYRRRSWDEVLMISFQYTKALHIWFYYNLDVRLAVIFGLLYIAPAVMYAMVWPPLYIGPRSYGKPFVPDHLHSEVMPSSGPPSGYWLVMFTVYSEFESMAVLPLFGEIATEFSSSSDRLHFGEVDIGTWKELAEHFKISTKFMDRQVPTLILFENGKEIRRLSPASGDGRLRTVLTRKNIVKYFGLTEVSKTGKAKKR